MIAVPVRLPGAPLDFYLARSGRVEGLWKRPSATLIAQPGRRLAPRHVFASEANKKVRRWPQLRLNDGTSCLLSCGLLAGIREAGLNRRFGRRPVVTCYGCHDHEEHEPPDEEDYCEPSSSRKKERCNFRKPKAPDDSAESSCDASSNEGDAHQDPLPERPGGYTISVSKELMGVFRYVEKVKRERSKDLADTLRKVSQACFLFSCVRGVIAPLVEVYKTSPPNWKNLLYMVGTFDSFAVSYLALKAAEPLVQLSKLTTETDCDMMGSIKKEEEHMLALAIDLVKLFRRVRNVTLFIALTQLVQVTIQIRHPAFVKNMARIFGSWLECQWGGS